LQNCNSALNFGSLAMRDLINMGRMIGPRSISKKTALAIAPDVGASVDDQITPRETDDLAEPGHK
jgi:hypothetical protein